MEPTLEDEQIQSTNNDDNEVKSDFDATATRTEEDDALTIAEAANDDNDEDDSETGEQIADDNGTESTEDSADASTPRNVSQPKVYSIDYLMQFKKHSPAAPPELMQALNEINAHSGRNGQRSTNSPRGGNRGGGRGGQRGRGKSASSSSGSTTPLRTTENKYTPADPRQLDKDEVLTRNVRLLLNKLTVEMYDSISKQLVDSFRTADTPALLRALVDEIIKKSLKEPKFNEIYARLCTLLTMSCSVFPNQGEGKKAVTFRGELLSACQREFEKQPVVDDPEGKLTKEERDEQEFKLRQLSLGNSKFIGELYKLGMLPTSIMHECIQRLLVNPVHHDEPPPEDSLETLSKLITTIGKKLEDSDPNARAALDDYFGRAQTLAQDLRITSRIRFMLRDLIDLRANNWVPRRKTEGPSTIAEVHKTAKLQDMEQQLQTQKILREANSPARVPPSPKRSPSLTSLSAPTLRKDAGSEQTASESSDDGFTPVKGSRPAAGGKRIPAPAPSPSRSGKGGSEWSPRGGNPSPSRGGGSLRSSSGRSKQRVPPRTPPPVNSRGTRGGAIYGPGGLSKSGPVSASSSSSSLTPTSSSFDLDDADSSPLDSSTSLSSSSSSSLAITPVAAEPLPDDVVEAKVIEILKEYFQSLEEEDSILCLHDLLQQGATGAQIGASIGHFYSESSTSTKKKVESFWPTIIEAKVFSSNDLSEAFSRLFSEVEDLVCDMPYISKCVGHLLGTTIRMENLPLSYLSNDSLESLPYPQALFVVASVLTVLIGSPFDEFISTFELTPYLNGNEAKQALIQHEFHSLAARLFP